MSNESGILVEKNYNYRRKYVTKNGVVKEYNQNVVRTLNKTDLERYFSKSLNDILKSTVELNKLNRIKNSIIRNKCYAKGNFIKQINKIDYGGELSKETKQLISDIHKQQYDMATEIEENLKLLLKLYRDEQKKIQELNRELKKIDGEIQ